MITPVYNDVAPIFQPEGSMVCGPTSIYVAAKYFGANVPDYQTFMDDFFYEALGTYMPQLGAKALELGLRTKIIMFNPHLFSVADIGSINPAPAFAAAKTKHADHKTWPNALGWFDVFHNAGG